jgi:hypothetical protein
MAANTVLGQEQLLGTEPIGEKWTLVILGDGYQFGEMDQFKAEAGAFTDSLTAAVPFADLLGMVNIVRIDVESEDSGVSDPGRRIRTFFGAEFRTPEDLGRLLKIDVAAAQTVVADLVPTADAQIVMVNTDRFGGSGDPVAAMPARGPYAHDLGIHEIGHSAFGLHDEYEYRIGCGKDKSQDRWPVVRPANTNITTAIRRADAPWQALIDPGTKVPTTENADCSNCDQVEYPDNGVIGTFEGAGTYHCGVYRPEVNCWMRTLGVAFCGACSAKIKATINGLSWP